MKRPVIFLAFANHLHNTYLPLLKAERKGIKEALAHVTQKNLVTCFDESDTTTQDLINMFDRYRGQIKIVHFGGHSNSNTLAFADQKAAIEGLAMLLATEKDQGGVELVFLNGCANQGQVAWLLEAGVKNVIATSATVTDTMASEFAQQFYRSLGLQATIAQAYQTASAQLLMNKKNLPTHLQQLGKIKSLADLRQLDNGTGLPWGLYSQTNADSRWTLPEKNPALEETKKTEKPKSKEGRINVVGDGTTIIDEIKTQSFRIGHTFNKKNKDD